MSDGGKGSKRRPTLVDKKTADENWNLIFGNKKQKEKKEEKQKGKEKSVL